MVLIVDFMISKRLHREAIWNGRAYLEVAVQSHCCSCSCLPPRFSRRFLHPGARRLDCLCNCSWIPTASLPEHTKESHTLDLTRLIPQP